MMKKDKDEMYDELYEGIYEIFSASKMAYVDSNRYLRETMREVGISNFGIVDTGSGWEQANIADGLIRISDSLDRIADAIESKSNINKKGDEHVL